MTLRRCVRICMFLYVGVCIRMRSLACLGLRLKLAIQDRPFEMASRELKVKRKAGRGQICVYDARTGLL